MRMFEKMGTFLFPQPTTTRFGVGGLCPPTVPIFSKAIVTLLAVVIVLTGCQTAPKSANDGKIEIEFWTLQLLSFEPMLTEMFEVYEKAHPNVKIKWVDVPFSEGEKRTLTAIMSPNVPDVVNLNPDFSAILASRKAVVNMAEYVPADVQKKYLPVAWQACTLKDYVFGVPWYITSRVTLYNESLLKEAGVSVPPESFDALVKLSGQLADKSSGKSSIYAAMPIITQSGNFLKDLKKSGIEPYNNGRAVFADNGAAQHLSIWKRLYDQKQIPPETLVEGHQAAVQRYQSGTLALLMTGPNFLNIVKENAPKIYDVTNVSPQFPTNADTVDFSTMVLVVPKQSKYPKEAVEFAMYMTNAANQLRFAHEAPILPSVTASLEDSFFKANGSTELMDRARELSASQLLKASQAYQIQPGQSDINRTIDHYVQLALLGKMEPIEAMQEAQDKVNAILNEQFGR